MELKLDGRTIESREELHTRLAEGLSLPAYYGRNLDALYDCLTDLAEKTTIVVTHLAKLEEHLGAYAKHFQRVLKAAAAENSNVRLYLGMEPVKEEDMSRCESYRFFSKVSDPFYSVTFREDVTKLRRFAREKGISGYYALCYLCAKAMDSIEAYRYAIADGELVMLDSRRPSVTDLRKGEEQFRFVTMERRGDIVEFCRSMRAMSEEQSDFITEASEGPDMIFFSCLPWIELTGLTNERNFDRDDSIPRVTWGRYEEEGNRTYLHISLELNHRFLDGLHVGKFHEKLKELIDELA